MDKKRSANLTDREKEIIISLVKEHFSIIENKKTNAVFNKQKAECWERLAWKFNSLQTSGTRTGGQIKNAYEQMKKHAKQHKAQEKVERLKTGGGTFKPILTTFDENVLNLLEENYFFINNSCDSNAVHEKSLTTSVSGPSTSNEVDNDYVVGLELIDTLRENITIVYEDDSTLPSSQEQQEDCLYQNNVTKKRKIVSVTQSGLNSENEAVSKTKTIKKGKKQWRTTNSINTKRYEILQKKSKILDLVEESEKENLQTKKLENQIKEILKERELIELKIKQEEYNNIVRV